MSSSYQPIAVVLVNDQVFQPVTDHSNSLGTLGYGFTASGHPVSTAVTLENLKVIEEDGLIEHAAAMGDALAFCPPLIIQETEVDEMLRRFDRALADTTAWAEKSGM